MPAIAPGGLFQRAVSSGFAIFVPLFTALALSTHSSAATRRNEGPASRVSDLVITELMYSPIRPDGEFIEIYNTAFFKQDLSGFTLSGDIDYTFADGASIPARSYLVVAKNPPALDISDAKGPYSGNLGDDGGSVELRSPHNVRHCRVKYGDSAPWPESADGMGHSLVIARPDYGQANYMSWEASTRIGGSPGARDVPPTDALSYVRINELVIHPTRNQATVELFNTGTADAGISGCELLSNAGDAFMNQRHTLGDLAVPTGGHRTVVVSLSTTFDIPREGGILALRNPAATRILDVLRYRALPDGAPFGRYPDGAKLASQLKRASLGSSNLDSGLETEDIVINEIMFNPVSGDAADEYIELYNNSSSSVQVGGWRITGGVALEIPAGIEIPAHGYLVLAKDVDHLTSIHEPLLTTANTVGDYRGTLSNREEGLTLERPLYEDVATGNRSYQIIDHVYYKDLWGQWSDAGGSSLELKDPNSDNAEGCNWTDSDETGNTRDTWTTVRLSQTLSDGHPHLDLKSFTDTDYEFQLFLQGEGECLVDNLSLRIDNEQKLKSDDRTFENGVSANWVIRKSNHYKSGHYALAGATSTGTHSASGKSLRIVAEGGGGDTYNDVEYDITPAYREGQHGELNAHVRWLKGSRYFILRLRGGLLEANVELDISDRLGSPGRRNSHTPANVGPSFGAIAHSPVIPRADQDVTITIPVADNDGVKSVQIKARLDGRSDLSDIAMIDDGTGNDAVAKDGIYTGTIPGRPSGQLVAFRVEAMDRDDKISHYPPLPKEALVAWGNSASLNNASKSDLNSLQLWMTRLDIRRLDGYRTADYFTRWSDHFISATLIYNGERIIHNAGVRFRGSAFLRAGSTRSYKMSTPRGQRLLGGHTLSLDGSDRDPYQGEWTAFWLAEQLGLAVPHKRYQHAFLNGDNLHKDRRIFADVSRPNRTFLRSRYPDDDGGELFQLDRQIELPDEPTQAFTHDPYDVTARLLENPSGDKHAPAYRAGWAKKTGDLTDFDSVYELVDSIHQTDVDLEDVVDGEQVMRAIAVRYMSGDKDGYGWNYTKNAFYYKPPNGKLQHLLWDVDISPFSGGPTSHITPWFSNPDKYEFYEPYGNAHAAFAPELPAMFHVPAFNRSYWRTMQESIPLLMDFKNNHLNERNKTFTNNGIPVSRLHTISDSIELRPEQVAKSSPVFPATFAITKKSIQPCGSETVVRLTGTGPLAVHSIRVNDREVPICWNSPWQWQLDLPLKHWSTNFELTTFDRFGAKIPSMTATLSGVSPTSDFHVGGCEELAHFPLDEGSGSTVNNHAIAAHEGTTQGRGVSWDSASSAPGTADGTSLYFDGTRGSVRLGTHPEYEFSSSNPQKNNVYSVALWVRIEDFVDGSIISRGSRSWRLVLEGKRMVFYDGRTRFRLRWGHTRCNRWTHLAVVSDGERVTCYQDGNPMISALSSGRAPYDSGELSLGSAPGFSSHIKGWIDDVHIYNYPLSYDEIKRIKVGGNPPRHRTGT